MKLRNKKYDLKAVDVSIRRKYIYIDSGDEKHASYDDTYYDNQTLTLVDTSPRDKQSSIKNNNALQIRKNQTLSRSEMLTQFHTDIYPKSAHFDAKKIP